MRTFVIADCHGHADLLDQLLAQLPIDWDVDTLVVLGDLVDRGPDSPRVIEMLRALQTTYPQVIILRGNHDEMMLRASLSERAFQEWLTIGGDTTYRSFCPPTRRLQWPVFVRSVPPDVWSFLKELPYWYHDIHGAYVHASANQTNTGHWEFTDHHAAVWGRSAAFFRDYSGPLVVVGHTPTRKIPRLLGEPEPKEQPLAWERGQVIAIDCGVSSGGPLCAVQLPERQFYYAF